MLKQSIKYQVVYNTCTETRSRDYIRPDNMVSPSTNPLIKKLFSVNGLLVGVGVIVIITIICMVSKGDNDPDPRDWTVPTPVPINPSVPTSRTTPTTAKCEINPLGSNTNVPLIIYTANNTLVYPKPGENTTKFSPSELLDFSCPNAQVVVNGNQLGTTVRASCKSGETFTVNGTYVAEWKNVSCSRAIVPTVKQLSINDIPDGDPNKNCLDAEKQNLTLGVIGFTLDTTRFVSLVYICFNTASKIAIYSSYNLVGSIADRAKNISTPAFRQDDIFYRMGKSVDDFYKNDKTTINRILNLTDTSDEYINNATFINRGHLAAQADFYYAALQGAVKRYINAAPQWNSFNEGNWNQAEIAVRNYAVKNKVNLQIWAGTYGIAMLSRNNNASQFENLYLYFNESDTRHSPALPVPEAFWKMVYNPLNANGIILVGHNNPYQNMTATNQTICADVSSKVSWLTWDKNNVKKGYSYACDCNDAKFHTLIPSAPNLNVKDLLI